MHPYMNSVCSQSISVQMQWLTTIHLHLFSHRAEIGCTTDEEWSGLLSIKLNWTSIFGMKTVSSSRLHSGWSSNALKTNCHWKEAIIVCLPQAHVKLYILSFTRRQAGVMVSGAQSDRYSFTVSQHTPCYLTFWGICPSKVGQCNQGWVQGSI